jgi:uncharacterized protein YgiM (DUF1202 family)
MDGLVSTPADDACRREYTATELNVEEGATVTVEFEESEWGWVTKRSGQRGWVPLEFLQALA